MKTLVAILIACAGCTTPPAAQDVWPQSAGIDAPSWPAASIQAISSDSPDANDGNGTGNHTSGLSGSMPDAAPVIAPAGNSSLPAVLPADASATLNPVAPRRLLVLFTAPKCKPCDELKSLLAQCESQVYGEFVFREVDITTFDCGLNSAPWLALFDAGTEQAIEGPTAAPKTLDGLTELLTRWGTL
jgi:hypothetical protein